MAPAKGSAAYKKKDGTVTISGDERSLLWIPIAPRDAPPSVTISIADISNLQQTPESAPKVMLKVITKPPDAAESVTYLFHFTSPTDPRGEANAVKDALTRLITTLKAGDPAVPKPGGTGTNGGSSAAEGASQKWFDDNQLKQDIELQFSLLKKDPALNRTYMESKRTKPDTISDSQFNAQFWSTRTNLLRAHAVEKHQQRGSYNVLSAVKPRQVDGELKLSISKEQVQLIFNQHPLVKRVYDLSVPKLNEAEFWSRFFLSRLFKKLKGERITENDSTDPVFDRYLDATNDDGLAERLQAVQIPHIIDIEANEENQGGVRSGNRKDWTMRPAPASKVPIVRTLNSLSEKIMANVAPSDVDPSNPIGMDEATYNQLALKDLQGDTEENRIILNIKEQSQFFANGRSDVSAEAELYAKQVPAEVLFDLQTGLDPTVMEGDSAGGLDLRAAIGFLEDSDSEDEEEEKKAHVGSKASLASAQKQILDAIVKRRTQMDPASQTDLQGLSSTIFDRLTLTHATTTEFLHHFWMAFLSGDPDKAGDLAKLVETLDRALDRINAVAADAEAERKVIITKQKQQIRDIWEKTGKRMQWSSDSVGGGEKVVKEMMEPTIRALGKATREYRKALAAEGVETV